MKVGRVFLLFVASCVIHLFAGCRSANLEAVVPVRVSAEIHFNEPTLTGPITKTDLAAWWNTKLKVGSDDPDAYAFLITTNGQDKRLRVETCLQYTNAIQQGAYSLTTADMAMESWFMRAAGTLVFIEKAAPSTHLLPDNNLSRLPISLVGWNGADDEDQIKTDTIKGMTLKNYARAGKVMKFKPEKYGLRFQTEGKDFTVEELARGDWDGDGIEDALISVMWHYREGSGFGYELYAVTKSTNGHTQHLNPLSIR